MTDEEFKKEVREALKTANMWLRGIWVSLICILIFVVYITNCGIG